MPIPLPELLAPAGSYDALTAAVDAGADAVYLGGLSFSARAHAANFDRESAARAVAYCHAFGVKVYAAMNTLFFDREAEDFLAAAADFYRMGIDALIVADLGGVRLLRRYLPDLPLHISTQASVHSLDGARAVADLGAVRAVLARELSLENIRHIATHAPLETEIFVHGALCVSHSGQCLFSSLVGGRSGNRGACAQPCRLPYNGGYPLSLRDLSLADHVPALIASGVSSLKIEGRMKSPSYVHGVVSVYRRLLDERCAARPEENKYLRELFSRDGFTDAYLRGRPAEPMTGRRTARDKSESRALPPPPAPTRKAPLRAAVTLRAGEASSLTLTRADGKTVCAQGALPAPARSAPLTAEAVCARLARLGGTPYSLAQEDIALTLDEGLNLSPAALNALRRDALALLDAPEAARAAFALPVGAGRIPPAAREGGETPFRTALFFDPAVHDALAAAHDYFSLTFLPLFTHEKAKHRPSGVYLPPVITDGEREEVYAALCRAKEAGIAYALVGNLGQIGMARELGFRIIGDFRLSATNRESLAALHEMGVEHLILSPELSLPRLRDLGEGSVIVCGRLPLMLLERCFIRENFGCEACARAALTDRTGTRFPLLREYPHRNLLLNSLPTYLGDKKDTLAAYRIRGEHFLFTVEREEEALRLLADYRAGRRPAYAVRGIVKP